MLFYKGYLFRKNKIERYFDSLKSLILIVLEKNWEYLPEEILNFIKNKNLDLVFKFGMNLLKIPEIEITKYGFFSYHHGDSSILEVGQLVFITLNNLNQLVLLFKNYPII